MRRKYKQVYLLNGKELNQNIEDENCYGYLHTARKTPTWDGDCLDCKKTIQKGEQYIQVNRPMVFFKFHPVCLADSHGDDLIIGVKKKKGVRGNYGGRFIFITKKDHRYSYARTVVICKRLSSIISDIKRRDENDC